MFMKGPWGRSQAVFVVTITGVFNETLGHLELCLWRQKQLFQAKTCCHYPKQVFFCLNLSRPKAQQCNKRQIENWTIKRTSPTFILVMRLALEGDIKPFQIQLLSVITSPTRAVETWEGLKCTRGCTYTFSAHTPTRNSITAKILTDLVFPK